MNHARRMLTIGAAVLVVSLTSCSDDGDGRYGTAAATTSSPAGVPGWLQLNPVEDGTAELAPGDYGLTANGLPDMPWAVVTVGGGFANLDGWLLKDPEDGPVRGVGYWTVSGVDRDPCSAVPELMDVGSSVQDLAAAFADQRLTRTTRPIPIRLDGHAGLYLELHVPSNIKLSDCAPGQYNVWMSDPRGGRYLQEPGQVDRLWILDVDGNVVVLHATAVPDVPPAWRQRQTAIVESARFVARD